MALFGFKKEKDEAKAPVTEEKAKSAPKEKKEKKKKEAKTPAPVSTSVGGMSTYAHVLRHPRVTEKATMHAEVSAYVFDVSPRATKRDIIRAVAAVYKVTPRMVRVVTIPAKARRSTRTGKRGVQTGGKKAYVYLNKGETIAIT